MSIANEIKGIRQSCFFSQNSFAEELGVSYSTVNRWETGKTVWYMLIYKPGNLPICWYGNIVPNHE